MHRLWYLVVLGVLAVVVSVVGAGPAFAAKGGNNDTAKVCQKGGWKALVSNLGDRFVNQGDCVNDGAQASPPFGTAGNATCADVSGIFMLRSAPAPTGWQCKFDPAVFPNGTLDLAAACASDTNNSAARMFVTEQVDSIFVAATCLPPPPT